MTWSRASSAGCARATASSRDGLGLGERVEEIEHVPRRSALELQRDSEALLLLLPDAGGRGRTVPSGKIYEYLAAERPILAAVPPDGVAAELVRSAHAGVVVAPDDVAAIKAAIDGLHTRWRRGALESGSLPPELEGAALPAHAVRRVRQGFGGGGVVRVADRLTTFFFLATIFSVSFQNVYWNVAGRVNLADILALMFLIAFVAARIRDRDRRVPATTLVVLCFAAALLVAYLIGFYNVETKQALSLWEKGLTKFAIHFAFLAAGVAYLARRSERFYWRTLGWFAAGFAANAAYGVLQLVATLGGRNLDALVLNPITGGASSINIWGAVGQSSVYRVNALTGDANHLGVMLVVPLLLLTPVYLRLEPGHRLRVPLAVLLGFLLLVELATLSRSGLLGLVAGGLVLAIVYRRLLLTRAMLIPLAAVGAVLAFIVTRRLDYFTTVLHARLQTNDSSSTLHFQVYDFIPQTIHAHPLFGFGLNTFSVYFEFVTGRTKWGAHSYYVATVVETGLVGTILFALFLVYLFRRLGAARRIGRALAAAGDPVAARVRPVAWGLTAALVGTIASNAFYLTMQFYYFYALALMALATPVVFARRLEP